MIINKINYATIYKNIFPKKAIIGTMIAGSLLGGTLTSCNKNNNAEGLNKEKIEYVSNQKPATTIKILPAQKEASITNLKFISEKDSPLRNIGKRLTIGLLGGMLGGLIGAFRTNKTFLTKASQCAAVGAAAGVLFPGLTLTSIVTLLSIITGGAAGTMLSGGNEKVGKVVAALFGILAAAACIF